MSYFAVTVLSYNHPDITEKCILSIQKIDPTQKIFLIHNGSTEKNVTLLTQKFPQITHLLISKNRGFSGGANFALSTVFKKYSTILFLTNDTELIELPKNIPTTYTSVKSYKRQTEQIDSLGGLIDIKNGKLIHRKTDTDIYDPNLFVEYIPGTAFWINKSIYDILGGFDETYHTYWEDVDLSYRAHLLKIPLAFSEQTVIRHKIGKTCHKNDYYTYYLFQRNRKKFMIKHKLTSLRFWFLFYLDLFKKNKYRFKTTWKIIYET